MVLFNFGQFQRKYAPKTRLVSRFLGWYGTLLKECTRTVKPRVRSAFDDMASNSWQALGRGGNTQVIAYNAQRYRIFGETIDMAVGNCLVGRPLTRVRHGTG